MVTPLPWESAWMQGMAEKVRAGQSLYGSTHAVHACCLFREDRLLCCREDIGRHNALDKVIGWALITGTWRRGAGGDSNWKGMSPGMRHPAARGHLHHAASGDICPRSGRRANQRGRYYYGRRKRRSIENGEFPPAPLPRKPSWKSSDNLLFYEVLYSYEPDLPPFSEGVWGGIFLWATKRGPPSYLRQIHKKSKDGLSFFYSLHIMDIQSQAVQPMDHRCPACLSGGSSGLDLYCFPSRGLCWRRVGDAAVWAVWGAVLLGAGDALLAGALFSCARFSADRGRIH